MKRREFITLLGGAATASGWTLRAHAEQVGRIYRIAFMIPAKREWPAVVAFFDELQRAGFVEGRNLAVLPGGFGVRRENVAETAIAIVGAAPDAIVGGPDIYTHALANATQTIPVLTMSEDVVADGLVPSLARPGGNITGISIMSPELDGKRQDLLIAAVPGMRRMVALSDSTVPRQESLQVLIDAARARGIELSVIPIVRPEDILPAIDAAKSSGAQAINFLASSMFPLNDPAVFDHLSAARLPAIHHWPETAEFGGMMGYGSRFTELFRQRARLLVKVLRGTKPADLPVEQPTQFELVINLKAAGAAGHEIPAGLVLRADKVID